MSLAGHSVMHSTYFESPGGRAPLSGVHPGIFRPPTSPSLSTSISRDMMPTTATYGADSYFASPNVKRKRNGAASVDHSGPWGLGLEFKEKAPINQLRPQAPMRKVSRGSSRYTLAGEIATPGAGVEKSLADCMGDSIYSDMDYRRDAGPRRSQEEVEDEDEIGLPLSRYTTAESTIEEPAKPADGWGVFAFNTIGGVVGKVWNFCKGSAFKGFAAGGGQSFQISTPTITAPKGEVWCNEHDIPSLLQVGLENTPGSFPQSNHAPLRESTPDSTPRPAAKRRQVSSTIPGEELRRNWVMVSEETALRRASTAQAKPSSAAPSPYRPSLGGGGRHISRPVSRIQTTPSHPPRRQTSRASLAGGGNASSASFAPTRSPAPEDPPSRIPVRRDSFRGGSPVPSPSRASHTRTSSQFARIPSPSPYSSSSSQSHRRSQSAASPALGAPTRHKKRESMGEVSENSPRLGSEARKLAAKRTKEERQTDNRINDFNTRLQEMIRQGKEALGTTIEVDDDEGGGWEDD